jgi:2-alkyl-3-oxoalkanoate reductase
MAQSWAALAHLEQSVTAAAGIALRYGSFYGDSSDTWPAVMRARKFPVIGDGGGVWSHIHLDDAAAATVLALVHDGPAIYNITDDEPAPVSVWLPELAKAVG